MMCIAIQYVLYEPNWQPQLLYHLSLFTEACHSNISVCAKKIKLQVFVLNNMLYYIGLDDWPSFNFGPSFLSSKLKSILTTRKTNVFGHWKTYVISEISGRLKEGTILPNAKLVHFLLNVTLPPCFAFLLLLLNALFASGDFIS